MHHLTQQTSWYQKGIEKRAIKGQLILQFVQTFEKSVTSDTTHVSFRDPYWNVSCKSRYNSADNSSHFRLPKANSNKKGFSSIYKAAINDA